MFHCGAFPHLGGGGAWNLPEINVIGNLAVFFRDVIGLDLPSTEKAFKHWVDEHVLLVPHHLAHSALAAELSPFEKACVISIDGGGDYGDNRHLVAGHYDKKGDKNHKSPYCEIMGFNGSYGLANIHGWAADALGFIDDGKLSGLSAYGVFAPSVYEALSNLIKKKFDGDTLVDYKFEKKRYKRSPYRLDRIDSSNYSRHKTIYNQPSFTNLSEIARDCKPQDFAFTFTKFIIDETNFIIRSISERSYSENLCVSGGLFNNVIINNAVQRDNVSKFRNHFFSMAPGDAGLSLGLALYGRRCLLHRGLPVSYRNRDGIATPYLGPSFSDAVVKKQLQKFSLEWNILSDEELADTIVSDIIKGKIVGLFRGRAEYGPRSLGSRTILADPRLVSSKMRLNQLLKRRDWFMPFAPSILAEHLKDWVSDDVLHSPYMQLALNCNPEKLHNIPSGVHKDGSARFQTVHRDLNSFYYLVIEKFYRLTGIPMLLNTSFNRHGIATISNPLQALEHLSQHCIDSLSINNFYVPGASDPSFKFLKDDGMENEEALLANFENDHRKFYAIRD